jgi:hypothetical protein
MKNNKSTANDIDDEQLTTWVREVLHPDQLSKAKKKVGRMTLTKSMIVIIWCLRVYVVFMVLLTAFQIWNALHTGS